jgi:hypothetical protein
MKGMRDMKALDRINKIYRISAGNEGNGISEEAATYFSER